MFHEPRTKHFSFPSAARGLKVLRFAVPFAKISRTVGLRAAVENVRIGHGPRLQDIRHSFATRTLIDWYKAGLNVTLELPKLATYLGHVDIGHTYWYVEGVPELLQLAAERPDTHVSRGRV